MNRKLLVALFMIITLLTACSNAAYDEAMEKADKAIEKEAYEEAIGYYDEAIQAKPKDEIAPYRKDLSQQFLQALEQVKEGMLDQAEKSFTDMTEKEDDFLQNQAEEQLELIISLKETYEEKADSLDSIEEEIENESYEDALTALSELDMEALEHPYFQALKDQAAQLEKEAIDSLAVQEEFETLTKEIKDIKALADQEKYEDALTLIDDILARDLLDETRAEFEDSLLDLQARYEDALAAIKQAEKEKAEKEKQLEAVLGFWQHESFPNDFIYIQPTYFFNLVYESDVSFAVYVKDYEFKENELIIHTTDGSSFSYGYVNGDLVAPQGYYYQVSKSEIEQSYPYIDYNDFTKDNVKRFQW